MKLRLELEDKDQQWYELDNLTPSKELEDPFKILADPEVPAFLIKKGSKTSDINKDVSDLFVKIITSDLKLLR